MVNSRASSADIKYKLLNHHLATGTEATYTYTPASALDLKVKYRQIIVIITGDSTAQLIMRMKLNGLTDYDGSSHTVFGATIVGALPTAAAEMVLSLNTQTNANIPFYIVVRITCNDAVDLLQTICTLSTPVKGQSSYMWQPVGTATTITSIETLTSTSTWKTGTEITTYGLER